MTESYPHKTHTLRRASLRTRMAEHELDAMLITEPRNIRYLTGFTGSNAALLVHGRGEDRTVFCTDGRYVQQAGQEVGELTTVIERACAAALVRRAAAEPDEHGRTGFESRHVSVAEFDALTQQAEAIELRRTTGLAEQLRIVKDSAEVDTIRTACAAADRALTELLEHGEIRAGRTERQVARALENRMLDNGAAGPAFETIVATGANSAVPHHRPTDAELAVGDLVKLDFGARIDGYHSDMTRMLVIGSPADWQRELYQLVRTAQAAGSGAAVAGARTAAVDAAARDVIDGAGHGEEFVHGLGHGVGLDVHEAPRLAMEATGTLAAGMTVTVEPGVYLPGRGGVRIEDTLVVHEGGNEILTLSTKDLVTVS
ncbi:Xaa-Pro peptidase family protein [Haloechinothrix aidingensis]